MPEQDPQYFTQFDVQRAARVIMQDYPDLRTAVQDVRRGLGIGLPAGHGRSEPRVRTWTSCRSTPTKIVDWMKAASRVRGHRHQPLAAQAGTAREDRSRTGVRSGHPRAVHRLDAQRPGRRRAGDQVQGTRRAVRRVAAGRASYPRPARRDRSTDGPVAQRRPGATCPALRRWSQRRDRPPSTASA